jgi:peptide/nickel transport system substrate-binding protein
MDDKSDAYNAFAEEQRKKGVKDEDIANLPDAPVPLTITFKLRDGICFSDGKPVRPEDFVFAFKFTMDKRIAAPQYQAYLEKFKSVEKTGDKELVVKFREPYYDSLGLFSMLYALPEHFYSKFPPEKFNESTGLLLGSGPYRLEDPESWRPGSGKPITLVRNERYWGVRPAFDRFLFKEFTNDIARQTAFRNGEVDLFEARPEQYHTMKQEPALVGRSHHFDWLSLNGGYRYVAWQQLKNGKPTFFADKKVRQAMAMLVDRQRLVQEVMLGYAELATGPFSPAGFQIDKNLKPVPYDVAGGRKLLAEAGFTDNDGDGVLEDKEKRPFRFKLTYPSGSANYEKMVLAFKDAYARAGIVLEPDPTEWGAFSQKLRSKDFEAISLGWGGGNPESDVYQMFHSKWTQPNGDNFMCYINPELDKILEQARTTIDKQKRIPLWHKAHKIFLEDQPYMFLWFTKEMFWVDGRIKNVRPTPLGMPSSLHTEWYVPRDKRKWAK